MDATRSSHRHRQTPGPEHRHKSPLSCFRIATRFCQMASIASLTQGRSPEEPVPHTHSKPAARHPKDPKNPED
ncbi:hypothetical protein M419DRAFT_10379 [Trichoderma reesei RUT C-30]|uniref:Uncharacterized protein n=1 Tax=Hypocrea jecorina (strain ATCC 56765 / BCRC 32924 / NRRL 11460 / Rut C-30) TaxID=1344414 RepID=A0A024S6R4_HYPJR|nr:hypothetical protein M419DRAFT_10379 [Trichoderma reesei RUT C-30]